MELDQLLDDAGVPRPQGLTDIDQVFITNIAENADEVSPGSLYCCVRGMRRGGHDFARIAVERGAVAVVVDHHLDEVSVPQVLVANVRAAMAPIAAALFGQPGNSLCLVGVTGTNGKTTTTHVLAAILRAHSWPTATIGTLSGAYTSMPAPKLQSTLAQLRTEQNTAVVMEVSSHALVQHRVDALRFDVAIFTNLTQDHLDYHHTMEEYFEAKAQLFDESRSSIAVINLDDPWGRQLMERVTIPAIGFQLADAENLELGLGGSAFQWKGADIYLPIMGEFNVMNALAAATAARELGVPLDAIVEGLSTLESVPGRVESVNAGQGFSVFVDFAHTPDGLEKVLTAIRATLGVEGQLWVVFGAGGDRDADKRPKMGAIAEAFADRVVVTSDNPRSENPQSIIEAVLGGMKAPELVHVEPDRYAAIALALRTAHKGDVVVIAGKGHETTQDINGVKLAFDDRAVAAEVLHQLMGDLS